jgi:hypothetical protein
LYAERRNGDSVPFTMVTLKNNQVASYATGTLQLSNSLISFSLDHSTTVSGTQIPQLFSNRTATNPDCTGLLCGLPPQPFDVNQAENLGVLITERDEVQPRIGTDDRNRGHVDVDLFGQCVVHGHMQRGGRIVWLLRKQLIRAFRVRNVLRSATAATNKVTIESPL